MPHPKKDSQRRSLFDQRKVGRRRAEPLLVNGVSAVLAGVVLWCLSLAMNHHMGLPSAARALLAPAWMALAIGIALMLLHLLIKRRTRFEAAMLLRQHSRFLEPMPPVVTPSPVRRSTGRQPGTDKRA